MDDLWAKHQMYYFSSRAIVSISFLTILSEGKIKETHNSVLKLKACGHSAAFSRAAGGNFHAARGATGADGHRLMLGCNHRHFTSAGWER